MKAPQIGSARTGSSSPDCDGKRILFCGVPMVSLLPKNKGWQVQMRSSEAATDWKDVDNGWFPTRAMAEEEAPFLCEF